MQLVVVATWLTVTRVLVVVAQNCNYSRSLRPGEADTMFTPAYPGNYPGGSRCSWRVQTDPGAQITITCNDFNIPAVRQIRLQQRSTFQQTPSENGVEY